MAERLAKIVAVANEVAARDQRENMEKENKEQMMDLTEDTESASVVEEQSYEEKRARRYEESSEYCSFLYWREPVDDIVLDDIDTLENSDVIEGKVEEAVAPAPVQETADNVIHEAIIEEVKNELSSLDTESSTDDNNAEGDNASVDDVVKESESGDDDMILEAHISDTLEETDKVEVKDDSSSDEEEINAEEESSSQESRPTYAQALQSGSTVDSGSR